MKGVYEVIDRKGMSGKENNVMSGKNQNVTNEIGEKTLSSWLSSLAKKVKNIYGNMIRLSKKSRITVRFGDRVVHESPGRKVHFVEHVDIDATGTSDSVKSATIDGMEDNQTKPISFASVINSRSVINKVNFRPLVNEENVQNYDFVLPKFASDGVKDRYENSLVGYFIGKSLAFPVVQNYVQNTWSKFGFKKIHEER